MLWVTRQSAGVTNHHLMHQVMVVDKELTCSFQVSGVGPMAYPPPRLSDRQSVHPALDDHAQNTMHPQDDYMMG